MLHLKSINKSSLVETISILLCITHAQSTGREKAACDNIICEVLQQVAGFSGISGPVSYLYLWEGGKRRSMLALLTCLRKLGQIKNILNPSIRSQVRLFFKVWCPNKVLRPTSFLNINLVEVFSKV